MKRLREPAVRAALMTIEDISEPTEAISIVFDAAWTTVDSKQT
jgi:hypothetical protein